MDTKQDSNGHGITVRLEKDPPNLGNAAESAKKEDEACTAPGDDWSIFVSKKPEPEAQTPAPAPRTPKAEQADGKDAVQAKAPQKGSEQAGQEAKAEEKAEQPDTEMDKALPGEDLADKSALHNRFFRCLAFFTPLSLCLLLLFCCWTAFVQGDISCPKELANYAIFGNLSDSPLLPGADGVFMMPIFFWMAKALSWIPGVSREMLPPLASLVGAFGLLLGMWAAGKSVRLGRSTAMAAGLLLICSPLFLAEANFFGPAPLATGLCVASIGIIGRAWASGFSFAGMGAGYLLAAAAGLTGGIFYAIIPFLSMAAFGIWRWDFRNRRNDALVGFCLLVGALAVWAGAIVLFAHGSEQVSFSNVLLKHPNTPSAVPPVSLWFAAVLPFAGIVLCAPWGRVLRNASATLRASRRESATGILWIALGATLLLQPFAPNPTDVLPAVAITALFAGRTLLRLSKGRLKFFFVLSSLVLVLVALAEASVFHPGFGAKFFGFLGYYMPDELAPYCAAFGKMHWLASSAMIFLPVFSALAILHVAWRSNTSAAPLLMSFVMVAIMSACAGLVVAPTLATVPGSGLVKKAPSVTFSTVGAIYKGIMGPKPDDAAKTAPSPAIAPAKTGPAPQSAPSKAPEAAAPKAQAPSETPAAVEPKAQASSEAPAAVEPKAETPSETPAAVEPKAQASSETPAPAQAPADAK